MDLTLSKRADYVLRAAISLARAWSSGDSRKIREVVADTEIPATFASQVLADLVRAGLATSKAGRQGGYRLSRAPSDISVLEVIEAGEGALRADRCAMGDGPCRWEAVCPLHQTFTEAVVAVREVLGRMSLDELAERDAALEAGFAKAPEDSHRLFPLAVEISDTVHVELDLREASRRLGRIGRRLGEVADLALSQLAVPESLKDAGVTEASLAPVLSGTGGANSYLVEVRIAGSGPTLLCEGNLDVRTVDQMRSELVLSGVLRQRGEPGSLLDRQAFGNFGQVLARRFLSELAALMEREVPGLRRNATARRS
jgi:Rrf2 family protein